MNNSFGISDKSFELIVTTLAQYADVKRAVIFGSRAKGNAKKGSDIDIAIYGEQVDQNTALQLAAVFNEQLPIPYKVDVVAPDELENTNLVDHINRVGITLYQKA